MKISGFPDFSVLSTGGKGSRHDTKHSNKPPKVSKTDRSKKSKTKRSRSN